MVTTARSRAAVGACSVSRVVATARSCSACAVLGVAPHYSPNPAAPAAHAHVDWPFDLETGEFQPAIWNRWRAHDPVNMVDTHVTNLQRLRAIYVDAGTRDEFNLQW